MRVPDQALKSILFVGIKDSAGTFLPRATAFFVSVKDHQHDWCNIVTAQHVVSGLITKGHDVWIRINRKDGGVEEVLIPPQSWFFGEPGELETDVAVSPVHISPDLDVMSTGLGGTGVNQVLTKEVIKENEIGIGDEVVAIGLFRSHYGKQRNIPIVRIGNVAMMHGDPVWTSYCGYLEAHLVEMMSIAGLSGSPVFVNVGAARVVKHQSVFPKGSQFYFLGMIHGHFDIKNLNEDVVSDQVGESLKNIHTGIGVVIPAQKIMDALFQPELTEMRRKKVEEDRKNRGATADVAGDEHATDENPNHQEDFTRLLRAAVKTPARED